MPALPRRTTRKINQIARMASELESAIGIQYAMYGDKVRLGYPNGGSGRGGSDVSDPTAGAALDPVNGFTREEIPATEDRPGRPAVSDRFGMLELLERRLTLIHVAMTGLIDDAARHRRLSPELAHAAWVVERCEVPECVLNQVRKGLCWRHYRDYLEQRKQEAS